MELSYLQRLALFARRRYRAVFVAFGLLMWRIAIFAMERKLVN